MDSRTLSTAWISLIGEWVLNSALTSSSDLLRLEEVFPLEPLSSLLFCSVWVDSRDCFFSSSKEGWLASFVLSTWETGWLWETGADTSVLDGSALSSSSLTASFCVTTFWGSEMTSCPFSALFSFCWISACVCCSLLLTWASSACTGEVAMTIKVPSNTEQVPTLNFLIEKREKDWLKIFFFIISPLYSYLI